MDTPAALLSWPVAFLVHGALLFALPHANATPVAHAVDVDVVDTTPPVWPPAAAPVDAPPASPAAPAKVPSRAVVPRTDSPSTHASVASGGETGPAAAGAAEGEGLLATSTLPVAQPTPLPAAAPVLSAQRPPDIVDRSRRPGLVRKDEWVCPWPAEGDSEDIDVATVSIAVTVDASGQAVRADVLIDPGYGFGRAARRCAMQQRYIPGLDRDGHAIPTTTAPFRVRFMR